MCLLDNADGVVTTIKEGRYVTARKEHRCDECRRTIESGESYHTECHIWEGRFVTHKTCSHCMVVRNWLHNNCGGWVYGEVEEDAREHCAWGGTYKMDLYRAVVGMQQNWRGKFTQKLLPIPKPIWYPGA